MNKKQIFSVLFLLAVILALNIHSSLNKSLTYDEPNHHRYGLQILNLNSDRFDDSKMPISALNALPYWIGQKLPEGDLKEFLLPIEVGRIFTMLFSVLLGWYVFKWTKEIYGVTAGFFSLVFYAFCPNILAHSRLITTDVFAAFGLTLSCYYYYRFLKEPNWKTALWASMVVGFSQLLKYSCVYIYPLLLVITVVFHWGILKKIIRYKHWAQLVAYLRTFAGYALIFVLVSLLFINAGFLFNKSFTPLKEYRFRSEMFLDLQKIPVIRHIPVPAPYPYLDGLDHTKYRERTGEGYGNIYLFGEIRKGQGFPGYYIAASLLKIPIPLLILFVLAATHYSVRHRNYNFTQNESILIIPILFFAVYLNWFFRAQMGIRFLIIVFPLIFIFLGSPFRGWAKSSMKIKAGALVLLSYLVVSVMSYYPHFISYFNEFVPDRKMAYKYLADSNVDWGQNNRAKDIYLKQNPDIQWSPDEIVTGRIMVDVNELVGVGYPRKYRWLRENYEPVDHLLYSYLIFEVPEEDLVPLTIKYR